MFLAVFGEVPFVPIQAWGRRGGAWLKDGGRRGGAFLPVSGPAGLAFGSKGLQDLLGELQPEAVGLHVGLGQHLLERQ